MAHEGYEQRSKKCQEIGGSSSSQALSTHPKKIAKKARPNSFREECSPEDSPPRGGTPKSLIELECLKIRFPVVYTNREEVNYNKEDPRNIVTLQNRPCNSLGKERGMNERFWTFFHQD
jgi:hypothetical protein